MNKILILMLTTILLTSCLGKQGNTNNTESSSGETVNSVNNNEIELSAEDEEFLDDISEMFEENVLEEDTVEQSSPEASSKENNEAEKEINTQEENPDVVNETKANPPAKQEVKKEETKPEVVEEEATNNFQSQFNVDLKSRLSNIQFEVTQNESTEQPYKNEYWDKYEPGIYVDIIDGTPLFSSTTKYKSNTGWPSFTAPISKSAVREVDDNKLFYTRTEIEGAKSGSHIGHLFNDGPKDKGGLRYCMNSAALIFVPVDEMKASGYGDYLYLFGK